MCDELFWPVELSTGVRGRAENKRTLPERVIYWIRIICFLLGYFFVLKILNYLKAAICHCSNENELDLYCKQDSIYQTLGSYHMNSFDIE